MLVDCIAVLVFPIVVVSVVGDIVLVCNPFPAKHKSEIQEHYQSVRFLALTACTTILLSEGYIDAIGLDYISSITKAILNVALASIAGFWFRVSKGILASWKEK